MRTLQERRFFYTFLAIVLHSGYVQAGAWTQFEGQGQIILNSYYYTADEMFDNQGKRQNLPRYLKYELNPYMEYGLTSSVTVGANLSLQAAAQKNVNGQLANYGVGDSEFFAKGLLFDDGKFAVSATGLVKVPGLGSWRTEPVIGSTHPDLGAGISAGYGFSAFGQHHFVDVDTLYRYRFGVPKDQANLAATLGVHILDQWMLMPQMFTTYRIQKPQTATFTQSSGDDYNEVKLQLSAVYEYTPAMAFQCGVFADVAGENAGVGKGVLVSMWRNF
jgi:protein XagA